MAIVNKQRSFSEMSERGGLEPRGLIGSDERAVLVRCIGLRVDPADEVTSADALTDFAGGTEVRRGASRRGGVQDVGLPAVHLGREAAGDMEQPARVGDARGPGNPRRRSGGDRYRGDACDDGERERCPALLDGRATVAGRT